MLLGRYLVCIGALTLEGNLDGFFIVLGTINLLSSTSLQVVLQLYRNSTETKKTTHGAFLKKLSSNGHLLQITIIDNH